MSNNIRINVQPEVTRVVRVGTSIGVSRVVVDDNFVFHFGLTNGTTISATVGDLSTATIYDLYSNTISATVAYVDYINTTTITATQVNGYEIETDHIHFVTSSTFSDQTEGHLGWNLEDGTLNLVMAGGNVVQQIGQETYYYSKNVLGSQIGNGQIVYVMDTVGSSDHFEVTLSPINDSSFDHKYAIGIATEDINNGEFGHVTKFGVVRGLNTSGASVSETWNNKDLLYFSATYSGEFTKVKPTAPSASRTPVAIVMRAHATNGSLFVRFEGLDGYEYALGNPTISGQILSSSTIGERTWIDYPVAETVNFDATLSVSSTNVQRAIEELSVDLSLVSGSLSGLVAASVAVTPSLTISSTHVQAALEELSGEITTYIPSTISEYIEIGATVSFVSGEATVTWSEIQNNLKLESLTQTSTLYIVGTLTELKPVTLLTYADTGGPWDLIINANSLSTTLTRNGGGTAALETFELLSDGTDIFTPTVGGLVWAKGT